MLPTLATLILLTQSPQVSTPAPTTPPEPPKWEVYMGLQGGLRPDSVGFGGAGFLGATRQIVSFLRAELGLGLGAYSTPIDQSFDMVTLIRIGARLEWPGLDRWHPFLAVAFAHQHETPWVHVKMDPVPAVLGLSEHGVHHRSGIETGLGIAYDLRARKGVPVGGRIGVKASVTHLLGDGPPRYVELTTLVGLTF